MWDLSSLTRDQTCPPALEVQSINHWTTREAQHPVLTAQVGVIGRNHSPSLLLRKLRLRDVRQQAQSHTARKWQNQRGSLGDSILPMIVKCTNYRLYEVA